MLFGNLFQTKQVGENSNDNKPIQVTVINNQQPHERVVTTYGQPKRENSNDQENVNKSDKIPAHMSKKQLNGNLFTNFINLNIMF